MSDVKRYAVSGDRMFPSESGAWVYAPDIYTLITRLRKAEQLLNRWKVAAETGAGDLSLYADTRDFLASQEDKPCIALHNRTINEDGNT